MKNKIKKTEIPLSPIQLSITIMGCFEKEGCVGMEVARSRIV